jgi:hypothetical protein
LTRTFEYEWREATTDPELLARSDLLSELLTNPVLLVIALYSNSGARENGASPKMNFDVCGHRDRHSLLQQ